MFVRSLVILVSALTGALGHGRAPEPAARAAVPVREAAAAAPRAPQACPSYWVAADDGGVYTAGAAPFAGSAAGRLDGSTVVGLTGTRSGRGYWLAAADGVVTPLGDAPEVGRASRPGVVAVAGHPRADGYWLAWADGRVRGFGAARVPGGTPAPGTLPRPVVALASTPTGAGYWLVTDDGGVVAVGDARTVGSAAGRSRSRIVSIAATPSGRGYWLAAADGGVHALGDAPFLGAATGTLPRPVTSIAASPSGRGYWLAAADGRVVGFGDAREAAPVRYPTMTTRVVAIAPPARELPCPVLGQGRKVVFLGDSVMFDVAAALEPALSGVPGVGIASRPWFAYGLELSRDTYDWRVEWPKILAQESPDVVVVLVGFGDLWAKADAPAVLRPETPAFRARYADVVTEATRTLTAGGARLVWIGLPWVADTNIYFPNVRARVASVNQVIRDVVTRTPGASFVDAAALLAGPDGAYALTVTEAGRTVQLRKPDGLHLCPPGAQRLAQAAGELVVRPFGERLRRGWERGAWRDDVRFHQGPALDCK